MRPRSEFLDKLLGASRSNNSLLCVGLDVDWRRLPPSFTKNADGAYQFAVAIIEATQDLVCAYKPNIAFWEAMGPEGLAALKAVREHINIDVPVIVDAKRDDIPNTAEAYVRALFDVYGFDAATVNPYLGAESLRTFLGRPDRGAFVLCKTSNPGSGDPQDLWVVQEGKP